MLPPCASATCRATAKPRPTPSRLPVTNGSNRRLATSAAGPGPESRTSTKARPPGAEAPTQLDPTVRTGGFHRVRQHVQKQMAQLPRVGGKFDRRRVCRHTQIDVGMSALRAEQLRSLTHQRVESAWGTLQLDGFAQVEELLEVHLDQRKLPQRDAKRFVCRVDGTILGV